jgi:hypothetical protein
MIIRSPEKNFEELWKTFHNRYPVFELRNVDWKKQYDTYRRKVTGKTSDDELFDIFCQMLAPLHDGYVELIPKQAGIGGTDTSPQRKAKILARNLRTERSSGSSKRLRRLLSSMVSDNYRDPGLDASLLQVMGFCLHPDPRAGRR